MDPALIKAAREAKEILARTREAGAWYVLSEIDQLLYIRVEDRLGEALDNLTAGGI